MKSQRIACAVAVCCLPVLGGAHRVLEIQRGEEKLTTDTAVRLVSLDESSIRGRPATLA